MRPVRAAWLGRLSAGTSYETFGAIAAVAIGIITAFAAIAFRWLIETFREISFTTIPDLLNLSGTWYFLVIPAIGGLIVGPLIYFTAREAKGHGVPEVMTAIAINGGRIRTRIVFVKALASSITIGTGGSVGREGPIVQIGSAIGSTVGQKFRVPEVWIRTFVACGAAAGIATTFNAPLAGVLFSMEVILRRFTARTFGVVVLSSVSASVVGHAFLGDSPAFSIPSYRLESGFEIPLYIGLGILAALVGQVYMQSIYLSEDGFDKLPLPPWVKPAIGGLMLGAIGIAYPEVFGVGYLHIEPALVGGLALSLVTVLIFLKILATALTLGSGGSGGVFAPSLFIGAMMGAVYGEWMNQLFPSVTAPSGAYALVGMGAMFAGSARAPVTAIVILFEMTRDYDIILPLMAAVVVSTLISRAITRDSIYTKKIRRSGIILPDEEQGEILDQVQVSNVMTRDFPTVSSDTTLTELARLFAETGHHGFPVTLTGDQLSGIVTTTDLQRYQGDGDALVRDIATRDVIVAYPEESLHDVMSRLGGVDVGRIPVVRRGDARLLGVIRRHDFIEAYARGLGRMRAGRDRDGRIHFGND